MFRQHYVRPSPTHPYHFRNGVECPLSWLISITIFESVWINHKVSPLSLQCHANHILSITHVVIGCLSTIISPPPPEFTHCTLFLFVRYYQIASVASPRQNYNLVLSRAFIASNWIVFYPTEARLLLRSVVQWDPLKRPTIPAISMEPWMTGRKLHPGERLYREQVEILIPNK